MINRRINEAMTRKRQRYTVIKGIRCKSCLNNKVWNRKEDYKCTKCGALFNKPKIEVKENGTQ